MDCYVSPSGSDLSAGTQAAPFQTIQKAANTVTAGGTVHVAPGTYAETITQTVSGTAFARIRYVSDTPLGAKLVPAGAGAASMWRVLGGYIDIDGFEIDGTGGTNVRQGIYMTGGNSTVRNSWIHHVAVNSGCDSNGGGGITVDQSLGAQFNNYEVTGCHVHHIGAACHWIHGIYFASSGKIKNNIVHNANYGILAGHDPHDLEISSNTVFADNYYGIHYDGGCTEAYTGTCPGNNIHIYNNLIYDCAGGINGPNLVEDIGNNSIKNNLIFGSGIYGDFGMGPNALSQVSGTITANPQFVNYIRAGGGDYHLQSTSPAINAGISTYAPITDFDGITRPQGAGYDIGAYERVNVVPGVPIVPGSGEFRDALQASVDELYAQIVELQALIDEREALLAQFPPETDGPPPPLSTYIEMQTAVALWLNRTDLGEEIPEFIRLGEERIGRRLRLSRMIKVATLVVPAAQNWVALPSDWLAFKRVRSADETRIEYMSPDAMENMPTPGDASRYSIEGGRMIFGQTPEANVTLDIRYYARLPNLSVTSDNWLLDSSPSVYLYAALVEGALFTKNKLGVEVWGGLFDKAVSELQGVDDAAMASGSRLRMVRA